MFSGLYFPLCSEPPAMVYVSLRLGGSSVISRNEERMTIVPLVLYALVVGDGRRRKHAKEVGWSDGKTGRRVALSLTGPPVRHQLAFSGIFG